MKESLQRQVNARQQQNPASRVIQTHAPQQNPASFVDNRNTTQMQLMDAIQRSEQKKAPAFVDNRNTVQRKSTNVIQRAITLKKPRGSARTDQSPGLVSENIATNPFERCTQHKISIPAGKWPQGGTPPQKKLWEGFLVDTNKKQNATRMHVVNENFGGKGDPENIHPGSANLNRKHLDVGENEFKKTLLDTSKDNVNLEYESVFNWNYHQAFNAPTKGRYFVPDPSITISIWENGQQTLTETINDGTGMDYIKK